MMNEPTIRELICGYPEPTPTDITIVSDSLAPLTKEQVDDVLAAFYQRLFTRQPSLRQLFKSFRSVDQPDQQAMRLQRNKLAEIIALGLQLWEKPHQLIPALEKLGRQHHQYGVRDEYYEDVWIALCEVLSEAFGMERWEDICESWQRFLFLCARHMLKLLPFFLLYSSSEVQYCIVWYGTVPRRGSRSKGLATMTLVQQKKRVKVAIGHDHGNTETADYVIYAPELPAAGRVQPLQAISLPPGKIVQKMFPSAVAEGSKEELESLRVGTGRIAQSKAEELVISVNGGPEQFVGTLAQRQARQAFTGRGDIHRYESERSLITLLAGLGSLVEEEEIEAWVVTGLPVETFQKGKAIRRGAKDALEGDHRFVLNGGKERHARIHVVMVLMEGAGGLIAQGLDGDEVRQAILDMGGRTTDGVATEGQDPIRHLCGTLARGVEDSKEMLSRFVENDKRYKRALRAEETESILRTHLRLKAILGLLSQKMYHQPLSDLTPDQFEHVLRMQQTNSARTIAEHFKITEADIRVLAQEALLHDLGLQDLEARYRTLHARGTEILPIDLYTWTEKSLRSVGKDIASFASQLWRVGESGEVATDNALVLAAGGGAYYYLEDVRELIPEIKACERPEFANAAGYANVAYSALLEAMGILV